MNYCCFVLMHEGVSLLTRNDGDDVVSLCNS